MTIISAWWRLNIRFKDPVGDRVGVELLFNSVEFGVEHLREQERHNMTVITVGSKYEVYVRSQHPLTCKPWTPLSNPCNKVRGKYICKEVFLLPFFMRLSVWVCLYYYWVVMIRQMSIYHIDITDSSTPTELLYILGFHQSQIDLLKNYYH